jgi:hypothetical protein
VSQLRIIVSSFGLLVILAVGAPASAQDNKLDLRLRLKQGDVYAMKVTVEQRIDQTTGSNPQTTEQAMTIGYSMAVEEVDPSGNMKVATKYDSVQFRQKGPAGAVEYDSAKEPKQIAQAARPFAALVGLGFKITFTPEGKVSAVEGLDAMLAEMVRKLELPEGQSKAVQKVLGEQFGAEAMKQNLENIFPLYPQAPVAVGESWQRRMVVSKGFPIVTDGTYTLKARADGVAIIEFKAAISPNEAAGSVELGTGKMSYDLKGEQTGTAEVDEASGYTRAMTTQQVASGTIRFQGGGGAPEVVNPVTITEKVTMEATKK